MNTRILVSGIVAVSVVGIGFAQVNKLIGKWSGTMKIIPGKAPDGKPIKGPEGGPMPKFAMVLNANGTFVTTVTGDQPNQKSVTEGKYVLKGNTLTLNVLKRDGKPATTDKVRIITVSPDGKTLTTEIKGNMQITDAEGKPIKFDKKFVPPVVRITFKRA